MKSLEQIRAERAFAWAQDRPVGERAESLRLAERLPAMFQTNGLLAAWAFLRGGGTAAHSSLLATLSGHLSDPVVSRWTANHGQASFEPLGERGLSVPVEPVELRELTAQAIAYANWLKRAAAALGAGA